VGLDGDSAESRLFTIPPGRGPWSMDWRIVHAARSAPSSYHCSIAGVPAARTAARTVLWIGRHTTFHEDAWYVQHSRDKERHSRIHHDPSLS
jgi:hypothetical protein